MKPRRILDSVVTRDGVELVLYQHGDSFQIEIDTYDLMSSRAHGSEEELARIALSTLGRSVPSPHVLIGGLGMGFTLRATLDGLDAFDGGRVTVAEVFPAVVDWNQRFFGHLAGHPLDDPRTDLQVTDVQDLLPKSADGGEARYDVILLDVDNGPAALTLSGNERLYIQSGLQRLQRALKPGGVLAVWSANDDPRFSDRLQRAGFQAKTYRVRARAEGKGDRHTLFVGLTGTR